MLSPQLIASVIDPELVRRAPELIVFLLVIGAVFGGVWRIVGKIQAGQMEVVSKFLQHTETTADKQEKALAKQETIFESVRKSIDENTRMLGQAGNELNRAATMLNRLEAKFEKEHA